MFKSRTSLFLVLLLFPVTAPAFQRHAPYSLPEENVPEKGFRFGLRAGYDIVPEYYNNTPHIDYQGGLYAGLTAAYYWKWLSAGLDVDYIRNSPDNRYPSETIFDPAGNETIDNFTLNSKGVTRLFYGIGPGIHYTRPDKKFSAELNGRAGFANISGGELSFTGNSSSASYLLNYHAGYDAKNVLTAKGSLGFTYNFSDILGVHIGAYYMRHFGVDDLVNSSGYSAAYRVTAFNDDLDKYFIRDDAKPELDRLVQFMLDNPGIRVELSSHTDSRASHAYNQRLSQNRANAAREYLISKGVDPQRIEAVGYGETRLLNRCADGVPCSEAEHQLNRRTEMKVICPE